MVRAKQLGFLTPGAAFLVLGLAALCLLSPGCGKETEESTPATDKSGTSAEGTQAAAPREWTAERAHTALKAWNPGYGWDAAFRIEEGKNYGSVTVQ